MKNEGLFGLTSLIFPKKEILWVGSGRDTPPPQLKPLLPRIKFSAFGEAMKALQKGDFKTLILAWRVDANDADEGLWRHLEIVPRHQKILLIEGDGKSLASPNLVRMVNSSARVLFMPEDSEKLVKSIEEAQSDARDEYDGLDKHDEMGGKVARTKNLVRFVKELTAVRNAEGLIHLLKVEVKAFQRVKEPILAFARSQNELLLLYSQGTRILEKVVPGVWQQQVRIRLNDVKDSQYLANIFGRPFGKLLTIPLQLKRKSFEDQLKVSAVLFFEHALTQEELGAFLEFIEDRLQPMSIALDRLLLEQDLNEASVLWERTFDGLQDPVVIFDSDSQILRANKAFAECLSDVDPKVLLGPTFRHGERFYEVHSYEIALGKEARPTNVINHYVDVTNAHRLQKQMIQGEKMAALGHMAGHIAHELNNPLTGIRSLAQILIEQTRSRGTLCHDLQEVEKAAERCQVIIKNLLEFSRGGLGDQLVVISMNDIVDRTLPLLKTLLRSFQVELDLSSEDCRVHVEPHLMQQVVFNIVKNAAQAMGESGTLTLKTRVQDFQGKKMVVVSVADTGAGIDPSIQEQIFDFFFTTKGPGQGTGLGLSLSKSIIDRFHGTIEVSSQKDKGSEFVIRLPLAEGRS